MIVSPSILAADFMNLEKDIKRLNQTDCQWLHLDVMDGKFVEDITFGYPLIKSIQKLTDKKLDVHLMVEYPQKLVEKLCNLNISYLTIHAEVLKNVDFEYLINICKANNIELGLALNPDSKVEDYETDIEKINYVLLMSVYPGKGGQKFIKEVLKKEKKIRNLKNANNIVINIDGGVNDITIKDIKKTSINAVVSGSFLFKEDIQKQIDLIK